MTKTEIVALQQALNQSGLAYRMLGAPLEEDGIYGPRTQAAHRAHLDAIDRTPVPNVTPPAAKPWWTSRALWGALATLAASLGGLAGYALDASQLTELAVTAATLASGLLALVGTLRRSAPIDPGLVARLPGGADLRLPVRAPGGPALGSGPGDGPGQPPGDAPAHRAGPGPDPRGAFTPE